jgi:uncharacterized membrane protein
MKVSRKWETVGFVLCYVQTKRMKDREREREFDYCVIFACATLFCVCVCVYCVNDV